MLFVTLALLSIVIVVDCYFELVLSCFVKPFSSVVGIGWFSLVRLHSLEFYLVECCVWLTSNPVRALSTGRLPYLALFTRSAGDLCVIRSVFTRESRFYVGLDGFLAVSLLLLG